MKKIRICLFIISILFLLIVSCTNETHIHSFSSAWTSDSNYHWHESTCEHDVISDFGEHSWNDGVITRNSSHTDDGIKIYTCSVCGLTREESIPADTEAHTFSTDWTSDELIHWHASTCGHEIKGSEENHLWGNGLISKEPTHTEDGEMTFICTVCKRAKTEILPALIEAHSFSADWSMDDSFHWHSSSCNHDVISEKGEHCWNSEKVCSVCGLNYYETLFSITDDGEISVKEYSSLPATVIIPSKVFGVTVSSISKNCFSQSDITDVVIPDSVTSIKAYAFCACSQLESVIFGKNVSIIVSHAFENCTNLKQIIIPDSLSLKISDYAFYGCSNLESVDLGHSVTGIGLCSFSGCEKLTSISIPRTVKLIEGSAFYGCKNLIEIIFEGSLEEWNGITKEDKWDNMIPDSSNVICSNHSGHSFSSDWSSDEAFHWHEAICGHDAIMGKDEHLWDNGTESVASTCTEEGTTIFTCTICGAAIAKKIPLNSNAHVWDEGIYNDEGFKVFTCTLCHNASFIDYSVYLIGSTGPAGGLVFYDCDADNDSGNADGLVSKECGWRYLEAAPADLRIINGIPTIDSTIEGYSYANTGYMFGYFRPNRECQVVGTTSLTVGSGKDNTLALVTTMGDTADSTNVGSPSPTSFYAARLCFILEFNGFDDWFLSSRDEMVLMHMNLNKAGFGEFANEWYWTSCEYNPEPNTSWSIDFSSELGTGRSDNRFETYRIRPVRSF